MSRIKLRNDFPSIRKENSDVSMLDREVKYGGTGCENVQEQVDEVQDMEHLKFSSSEYDNFHGAEWKLDESESQCCAFCKELLSFKLPGETIIKLTCTHICHTKCYSLMIDNYDISNELVCTICKCRTKCPDETYHSELVRQKLLDEQMIMRGRSNESSFHEAASFSSDHTIEVSLSPDSFDVLDYLRPSVSIEYVKFMREKGNSYDVECVINVQQPDMESTGLPEKKYFAENGNIMEFLVDMLRNNVSNINKCVVPLEDTGMIIIFDFVFISTNHTEWDKVLSILFEKVLLLIDWNEKLLVGQFSTDPEICSVFQNEKILTLSLKNEWIPEIELRYTNNLEAVRWKHCLTSVIGSGRSKLPHLEVLTTTGWTLLSIDLRSHDYEKLAKVSDADENTRQSLLRKLLPPMELPCLNLIVVVPVICDLDVRLEDFEAQLSKAVKHIRDNLKESDRLGIIFLGVDGAGSPSNKSSFVSCTGYAWEGWDTIIGELKLFRNQNKDGKKVFTNQIDEVNSFCKKCDSLISFSRPAASVKYELIYLTYNQYEYNQYDAQELHVCQKRLSSLSMKYPLKIEIVRIGQNYSKESELLLDAFTNHIVEEEAPEVHSSVRLHRFSSLQSLIKNTESLFSSRFRDNYSPEVILKIERSNEEQVELEFEKINTGGVTYSIKKQQIIPSLHIQGPRGNNGIDILIKLKLGMKKEFSLKDNVGVPVFNYEVVWQGKSDHRVFFTPPHKQITDAEVKVPQNPIEQSHNTDFLIKRPSHFYCEQMLNYSSDNFHLIRYLFELEMIEMIRNTLEKGLSIKKEINSFISSHLKLMDSHKCNDEFLSFFKDSNWNYDINSGTAVKEDHARMKFLGIKLTEISKLSEAHDDLAALRCKDLMYSIF